MTKWLFVEEIPRSNCLLVSGWGRSLERDLEKWWSVRLDNVMAYKGYYSYLFFSEEKWLQASKNTFNKTIENPDYMLDLNRWNRQKQIDLINFTKKMQADVKKLSTNELIELFDEWQNKYFKESMISGWTEMALDWHHEFFSKHLTELLKEKIKENKVSMHVKDLLTFLTTPSEKTFSRKELESMLRIAVETGKNRELKKFLLKTKENETEKIMNELKKPEFKKILRMLEKYFEEFRFMSFMYNGPGVSLDYYVNELQKAVKEGNAEKRLAELKQEANKIRKRKRELFMQLGLDEKQKKFFQIAENIQFNKDLRLQSRMIGFYRSDKLLKELCKRLNYSLTQIRFIQAWEIPSLKKEKIPESELSRRFKGCYAMHYGNGKFLFVSGEKSLQKIDELLPKYDAGIKELQGSCAFPGKIRGIVKIINSPEDMHKMNQGDVLIAVNTDIDLVPAMKLAGAIATDVGGLTCHAAIVSRELRKPCIVGLKIATKVFKDNDVVQVDATHGKIILVKRLKREESNLDFLADHLKEFNQLHWSKHISRNISFFHSFIHLNGYYKLY